MNGTLPVYKSSDETLGREFLTWLWCRSEIANTMKDEKGEEFAFFMEQRVVVQGGEGEMKETASVSGAMSELREARLGLATGKKVTRAMLRLEQEPESWQLVLKADDFCLGSLKTPKIESAADKNNDPEALFFEKVYLLEKCVSFLDILFKEFLRLRLSKDWATEVNEVRDWLYQDRESASAALKVEML
jgi:hypothetical protein